MNIFLIIIGIVILIFTFLYWLAQNMNWVKTNLDKLFQNDSVKIFLNLILDLIFFIITSGISLIIIAFTFNNSVLQTFVKNTFPQILNWINTFSLKPNSNSWDFFLVSLAGYAFLIIFSFLSALFYIRLSNRSKFYLNPKNKNNSPNIVINTVITFFYIFHTSIFLLAFLSSFFYPLYHAQQNYLQSQQKDSTNLSLPKLPETPPPPIAPEIQLEIPDIH